MLYLQKFKLLFGGSYRKLYIEEGLICLENKAKRQARKMVLDKKQTEAIERLYRKNYAALMRYAISKLKNSEQALDAVQETFHIACVKVESVLTSPNPTGWLFLALKNVMRNMCAKQRRAENIFVSVENYDNLKGVQDVELEPGDLYGGAVTPEELRLLQMVAVEGYTLAEAAAELQISTDACKKRFQRAKAKFRENLAKFS